MPPRAARTDRELPAHEARPLLRYRHVRDVKHEIALDGARSTTEATEVFIANFGQMGSLTKPRREIQPDDGLLDVIIVRARGSLLGLLAGLEALWQRDLGMSAAGHALRAQAREVPIETKPDRLVETDGSVVGTTPIVVSNRPGALTVFERGPRPQNGPGLAELAPPRGHMTACHDAVLSGPHTGLRSDATGAFATAPCCAPAVPRASNGRRFPSESPDAHTRSGQWRASQAHGSRSQADGVGSAAQHRPHRVRDAPDPDPPPGGARRSGNLAGERGRVIESNGLARGPGASATTGRQECP